MRIYTNPDKEYVAEIRRQLKANSGYCPCALLKNKDTKCMCVKSSERWKRECAIVDCT